MQYANPPPTRRFARRRKKFTPQTVRRVGERVVKVTSWDANTVEKVVKEVVGANSVVLDLTGNPGGLMTAGVDLANEFLDAGDGIVRVVDKTGVVRSEKGLGNGRLKDVTLDVLVDENTASASEVFTGAIQDNGRGKVLGVNIDHTYGKGVIQTVRGIGEVDGEVRTDEERSDERRLGRGLSSALTNSASSARRFAHRRIWAELKSPWPDTRLRRERISTAGELRLTRSLRARKRSVYRKVIEKG